MEATNPSRANAGLWTAFFRNQIQPFAYDDDAAWAGNRVGTLWAGAVNALLSTWVDRLYDENVEPLNRFLDRAHARDVEPPPPDWMRSDAPASQAAAPEPSEHTAAMGAR